MLCEQRIKLTYNTAQAQFELRHPNEALSSAITAYDICSKSAKLTSSAFSIAGFVLKCKRAKWDVRERDRLRRRSELLSQLEGKLEQDRNNELGEVEERLRKCEIGEIGAKEEKESIAGSCDTRISELRSIFAIADPQHMEKREVPDYLIDASTSSEKRSP